jgi:hypothetical protein
VRHDPFFGLEFFPFFLLFLFQLYSNLLIAYSPIPMKFPLLSHIYMYVRSILSNVMLKVLPVEET